MARLSADQALSVLKEQKNKALIAKAIKHEQRLRLHAQSVKSSTDFRHEHEDFKSWVKTILHPDKYNAFKNIFRPPFTTNSLLEGIYDEYGRVFKGDNFFVKFQFNNPDLRQDAEEQRKELQDKTFFETEGFEALKKRISSILIVDLPAVQKAERPEPYFYLLDIDRLIDIEATKTKITGRDSRQYHRIEYLAFKEGEDKAAVFCDEYYRTYTLVQGNWKLDEDGEKQHSTYTNDGDKLEGPGRCPAQFFWNITEDDDNFIIKDSPVTASLSDLDWLLAWSYFERMFDLFGPFPIMVGMSERCDYTTQEGNSCDKGFVLTYDEDGKENRERCPECATSKLVGPGTFVEKKAPEFEGMPEWNKTIEIIAPPIDGLTYVGNKTSSMKDDIFYNTVGKLRDKKDNPDTYKNEQHIQSRTESQENVIFKIKQQFELIHGFALEMWGKLRYGQQFEKVVVNYGDKFYLKDELAVLEELKLSKEAGLPIWEISNQISEYILTKYRNNPDDLQRSMILNQIEPFPGESMREVLENKKEGMPTSEEQLILKANFGELISRFEREFLPIHLFIEGEEPNKAVEKIKNQLKLYTNELNIQATEEPGPVGSIGNQTGTPTQRASA